ncbi:hypothetical protein QIS99_15770 [Streptomyces sp. B-S-A8]|uniref:Integral membrane protein n=1 Tax=Streptomyces solicavernae TaxID=3043614 RepID=A0ABT6RT90_9ACTN|nr:hypothetical protein [Streptomyces sp. B-S-A8]MDI3387646.1 hypothetical protein [Streptomyces sp. B-S-A8]
MRFLDGVLLGGRVLAAVALLALGGLMVLAAGVLAVRQEFVPALACGVLATVPLGPGVVMTGDAIRLRREARDPSASLQPVRERRSPGLWSTLGRLRVAVLHLTLGLTMVVLGVGGLRAHSGAGQVLFALLLVLLGVTALGIGLSVLVNRGYWLWDEEGVRGGPVSQWRGSKRRW